MDSGATNHVTNTQGNLSSIHNLSSIPMIKVGNGSFAPVTNVGHGTLHSPSRPFHLKNILVCPSIIKNLISVRRFVTDNNCSLEFDPFGFSIKDLHTRTKLLRCNSTGPLYSVSSLKSLATPHALTMATPNSEVWHKRLGHLSSANHRQLASSSTSISFNKINNVCHACQLGKHARLPFIPSSTIVSKPFDLIHSDIWTSPVLSLSGIKYYLLFLDHFSQFVWIYPLKHKSDTFSRYLHFSNFVKTQFQCTIKSLQCDNGGEFNNRMLLNHLASEGTTIRFSCPHTSQQNGKAERMLRTINNIVRTMLAQASLPYSYWVEALHTAVYLLNIAPSSTIDHEIPYTKLFQKPVSYSHLRIFGCLCYPNLLPTSPHKLAPRSTACIFLGYPSNHRGYRCLDLSTHKIILSRHVIFDEAVFPFSKIPQTSAPSTNSELSSPPPIIQEIPPPATSNFPPAPLVPPPVPPAQLPPNPPQANHSMTTRSKNGITKPQSRLNLNVNVVSPLPISHVQAAKDPYWHDAMNEEYNAQIKNGTWDLVPRPANTNIIRSLWLFKHKYHADGSLARYKARLVANGKSQEIGVDCDETFSPVVKPATIRTVLHLAVTRDWPIRQLDVKNAFLNGDLDEVVYMHQPAGYVDPLKPNHVCLLRRSLYGLKQAPRAWNTRFATVARQIGFKQSISDPSLFVLKRGSHLAYLLLYVDDIALTASSTSLLDTIVQSLNKEFEMTDLGQLHHFLGITFTRSTSGLFLHQRSYASDIIARAGMSNCKPCLTPVDTQGKLSDDAGPPVEDPTLYRSLAGALQYLTFTRPDISFAVQQICLFMHDPRESHFNALRRIIRYLQGTLTLGLHFYKSSATSLIAYTDADWAGCPSTRRSTSGFCIFFGDNLISWSSKRQPTVSRSSAEAEYKGVANAVSEATWLRNLLLGLHVPMTRATLVYCDNISAVYLSSNPVKHQRTKHIEIDIHFVREKVALGHIRVLHVPSAHQYADIFTKGLPSPLFLDFRSSLSIRQPNAPTVGE